MLSLAPRRSLCTPNAYVRSTLNPYLTVLLTFLSTILKQTADLNVLKRAIPWQELATLFGTIPQRVMASQGLLHPTAPSVSSDCWAMLTSGVAPPFSEDWCKRGVEWVDHVTALIDKHEAVWWAYYHLDCLFQDKNASLIQDMAAKGPVRFFKADLPTDLLDAEHAWDDSTVMLNRAYVRLVDGGRDDLTSMLWDGLLVRMDPMPAHVFVLFD
ncbi:hypothetical protein FA13DRAFT_1788518 [Coprinellus micaceus]|uniref:Uncharacterized protein n=1 Tax=Coprinellus micaceus TaxID=71717 RepID=A0A4Y7TL31_COPMI|nr:hypothetical protein FA13DRAFT_1788518 [Coprinellus micaceus]